MTTALVSANPLVSLGPLVSLAPVGWGSLEVKLAPLSVLRQLRNYKQCNGSPCSREFWDVGRIEVGRIKERQRRCSGGSSIRKDVAVVLGLFAFALSDSDPLGISPFAIPLRSPKSHL